MREGSTIEEQDMIRLRHLLGLRARYTPRVGQEGEAVAVEMPGIHAASVRVDVPAAHLLVVL
jgi:hypothetical protein